MSTPSRTEEFEAHRSLLFTVAYEMLGSAADADDVVQESWLQWADVDDSQVRVPRAFLIRIVTRQALNRLRTLSRRRENYVGEWLPEPLLTTPDVADDVEFAESISIAMLTVLETLSPTERAVFVLHEVFAVPYDEIAASLDKTPAATRQTARRARLHVEARRPRIQVSRAEHENAVERLLVAVRTGDIHGLMSVLAPDVVAVADGGGLAPAARRPINGADRVAKVMLVGARTHGVVLRAAWVNGAPAVRIEMNDELVGVTTVKVENGSITGLYLLFRTSGTRFGSPMRPGQLV
ncbi:MAG TPA: RNA polymerase sigma factor SigJ [Aldersonia sp.]